jgi:uncharacterized protein
MVPDGWQENQLPDFVHSLHKGEEFKFACHKGVSCFTECCRLLELALTPYDILRLRRATGIGSKEFLEKYVIVEQEPDESLPRLYLTMVDDGRGSCPFVIADGCSVYEHRPGACRAYPLGRAARHLQSGNIEEQFVLVKEEHCRGFEEDTPQTAERFSLDQGMTEYCAFNDALANLLQHGKKYRESTEAQRKTELFLLALYNLDEWRTMLAHEAIDSIDSGTAQAMAKSTDEELLLFSFKWLSERIFC